MKQKFQQKSHPERTPFTNFSGVAPPAARSFPGSPAFRYFLWRFSRRPPNLLLFCVCFALMRAARQLAGWLVNDNGKADKRSRIQTMPNRSKLQEKPQPGSCCSFTCRMFIHLESISLQESSSNSAIKKSKASTGRGSNRSLEINSKWESDRGGLLLEEIRDPHP